MKEAVRDAIGVRFVFENGGMDRDTMDEQGAWIKGPGRKVNKKKGSDESQRERGFYSTTALDNTPMIRADEGQEQEKEDGTQGGM